MKIAIIGCGYVGKVVARYWHQDVGLDVTVTTTTPAKITELAAIFRQAIVLQGNDREAMQNLVQNQDVILLSVGAKNANLYVETYLQTSKILAEILKHNSTTVKQVIYTSTCSIYGNQDGALVDEDSPVNKDKPNVETLQQTEEILLSIAKENLRVCILRLGGIYGPGRELVKIFSRVAGTTRPGKGNEPSNWIHLDDIVGAIEFARQQQLQGIYNLVDDSQLINRELIDKVCEKHGLAKVYWDESLPSVRNYNARISNQKIKAAGYQLKHPEIML